MPADSKKGGSNFNIHFFCRGRGQRQRALERGTDGRAPGGAGLCNSTGAKGGGVGVLGASKEGAAGTNFIGRGGKLGTQRQTITSLKKVLKKGTHKPCTWVDKAVKSWLDKKNTFCNALFQV